MGGGMFSPDDWRYMGSPSRWWLIGVLAWVLLGPLAFLVVVLATR